jgi:hypothetical protein
VDNSIRLKELQVISGALRERDKRLEFFWVKKGGWGNSTPFQRRFLSRDLDR